MKKYQKVKELPDKINDFNSKKFIISSNSVNDFTHIFHKYPAKFIPHIPRWGIKFDGSGELLVIDPFCGSGTSNLEALLLGHASIGFDIDPLAILISKVKITPIKNSTLNLVKKKIFVKMKKFDPSLDYTYPDIENFDHWFSKDAKKKIAFLKELIIQLGNTDIRDFFIVTLSSIIRQVSNADNQSQKTYVSHTLEKTPPEVFSFFEKRVDLYMERMGRLFKKIKKNNNIILKLTDTTDDYSITIDKFSKKRRRLIITSPPYIKAIDYIYNQMLEYFWLGDILGIESRKKMNEYKQNYIGTKKVFIKEYKNYNFSHLKIDELDQVIKKIERKSKKHAYITYKYFDSMKRNLTISSNILRKGEYYLLVVGNTCVSGVKVNTARLLGKIASRCGYRLKGLFSYKIRNRYMRFDRKGRGGIVDEDNILILEHI